MDSTNRITPSEIWDRWTGFASPASELAEAARYGRTIKQHAAVIAEALRECQEYDGCGDESEADLVESFVAVLRSAADR